LGLDGRTVGLSHSRVLFQDARVKAPRWSVYIVRCADGTLYTGVARDVAARIAMHDAGRGARYTRGRGPLRLLATKKCASHGDALRVEMALKKRTRDEKEELASSPRKLTRFVRAVLGAALTTDPKPSPSRRAR
jgi:putative endonuclease